MVLPINLPRAMRIDNEFSATEFLQSLLVDIASRSASDIHLEPRDSHYQIRFRCDGILIEYCQLALAAGWLLCNHIKILAELDIAEHRLPQDGHFAINLISTSHECRVNCCPSIHGEKIVLRLLPTANHILTLDQLGMNQANLTRLRNSLQQPQGLILFTGPTGSGKSLSLYASLKEINHPTVNIITIEDPVEIKFNNLTQININPSLGFDFADALRTILRQDPDIIMLGEIRDLSSAQAAIQAAHTGHLVLASLHCTRAISCIARLLKLGIPSHFLAESLTTVVAQRLVRKICQECKQRDCTHCYQGYSGRTGLFELISIDSTWRTAIEEMAGSNYLTNLAYQQKLHSLREDGADKILAGITDQKEVTRVIGNDYDR